MFRLRFARFVVGYVVGLGYSVWLIWVVTCAFFGLGYCAYRVYSCCANCFALTFIGGIA